MVIPRDVIRAEILARWQALQPRIDALRALKTQEDAAREAALSASFSGGTLSHEQVMIIYADADPVYLQQMLQYYAAQQ